MLKNAKSKQVGRTRNYATIVYPESAPENWKDIIAESHVPCFISPIHDQDVNPDGEPKKPHYHVMIMYDNVKRPEQAQEFIKSFNGVGCETVSSTRGMARYLCHLDNPEKHQYNTADVLEYSGADYMDTIGLASDKYKILAEILDYCSDNGIVCYADLVDYARKNREDWFRVLCDGSTIFLSQYFKSVTWRWAQQQQKH